MVLIASLAFSISMIQTSFEEWRDFPIVTTVERTDGIAAVDNIFPSVTICRGSTSQPDNWVLSELILDFFEVNNVDDLRSVAFFCFSLEFLKDLCYGLFLKFYNLR